MEFDREDWDRRYKEFRRRADQLHSEFEGKPIDPQDVNHPWLKLMREESDLLAELPPTPVPSPYEMAISDLTVTAARQSLSRDDAAELTFWRNANYAGTPSFANPLVQAEAAKVMKWRDRELAKQNDAPQAVNTVSDHMDAETRALAFLAQYPGTKSIDEIAKLARCSRQYLSDPEKCPRFRAAWDMNKRLNQGQLTHGSKSKTGDLEAWK